MPAGAAAAAPLSSRSLAAGFVAVANGRTGPAPAPKSDAEKCYPIAKAGKNDCQTDTRPCAGTSKKDRQTDARIYDLRLGAALGRQARRRSERK